MKDRRRQIALLAQAESRLDEARGAMARAFAACPAAVPRGCGVEPAADALSRDIAALLERLRADLSRMEREAFGVAPVLQVPFGDGAGREVRIVVARPDAKCDEPYMSRVQFEGVCGLLGLREPEKVRAKARFAVAVLDHLGFRYATVRDCGTEFAVAAKVK